jgi:hypothetical protein
MIIFSLGLVKITNGGVFDPNARIIITNHLFIVEFVEIYTIRQNSFVAMKKIAKTNF